MQFQDNITANELTLETITHNLLAISDFTKSRPRVEKFLVTIESKS